jgi:hypothetical protein
MCQELADLAMQLTRAAASKALQSFTEAEAPPQEILPDTPPTPKHPDPTTLFTRLSAAVRQAITLEARIAASPALPGRPLRYPAPDSRREILRTTMRFGLDNHPDRATIRPAALNAVDQEIARDPDGLHPLLDIVTKICDDLNLELDPETIPEGIAKKVFPAEMLTFLHPNGPPRAAITPPAPPTAQTLQAIAEADATLARLRKLHAATRRPNPAPQQHPRAGP